jgi:hypothetical protein
MAGRHYDACKTEIKSLCAIFDPQTEIGLIDFASEVNVSRDIGSSPISPDLLPDCIDSMRAPSGSTALYDAILQGLNTLKAASSQHRDLGVKNILIVYTDGEENRSKTSLVALSIALRHHNIPNFRFIFAHPANIRNNLEFVRTCRTESFKSFCVLTPVEDSKEGIASAFSRIREEIKDFNSQRPNLSSKSVQLKMRFGESMIKAKATCPSTGESRHCSFEFHAKVRP